jgi:large subunit ribosomal protein L23
MAKQILIKPVITEKADALSEKRSQYTFIVSKDANKVEIKKAVNSIYNVEVASVNTILVPSKAKSRNTRRGVVRGRVSGYKKAIVTLAEGETINIYGEV